MQRAHYKTISYDVPLFLLTGETQEECNKCGKVYMAPESDKGRGTCPECAPPPSIVIMKTDGGGSPSPADDASYGGNSTVDSEDSRSSSMGSMEDKGV